MDLQNNEISDPGIIDILKQIPELKCLYLKGNPVVPRYAPVLLLHHLYPIAGNTPLAAPCNQAGACGDRAQGATLANCLPQHQVVNACLLPLAL